MGGASYVMTGCYCFTRVRISLTDRAILEKWVSYSQRYLFNAIHETNHNANPTNPNRLV